jgi:hypothetical protein
MPKFGNPPLDVCTYGVRRQGDRIAFLLVVKQEGRRQEYEISDSLDQLGSFIRNLDEILGSHRTSCLYVPASGNIMWEVRGSETYCILSLQSEQPVFETSLTHHDLHRLADSLEEIRES